ncbi:uracil-DNA glycosylase [Halobacterium rubrum]|uniref:uracil-DNA glycosylase n=1 Tax=Halobacterium TaxID=2239 RepID=UPI003CC7EE9E
MNDEGEDGGADSTAAPEAMDGLAVEGCTRCGALVDSRSQIVNGDGPADVDVLFVGEAPGANEDEDGVPFVGRSGDVLDDELADAGLARENVRITNCVRCRPPDNRDPTSEELANCRPHLEREIELVDPEVVVTLGKVPGEHLLGRDVAVTNETGSVERVDLGGSPRDVLLCLHPAATLYDASQRDAFRDTIETAATMAGASGGQSRLGDY